MRNVRVTWFTDRGERDQPSVEGVPGTKFWILKEDVRFVITVAGANYSFLVKAGYLFDGASIPAFAWWIVGPPMHPDRVVAALFHDYGYEFDPHQLGKAVWDAGFKVLLVINKCPKWRANTMYATLRTCGWVCWNRARKAQNKKRGRKK